MTFYGGSGGGHGSSSDGYAGAGYVTAGSGSSGGDSYALVGYGGSGSSAAGNGGSGSGSSYTVASANIANYASDGGYGLDKCAGATLIHDSMEGNDYSDVDGVKNVQFKQNTSCPPPAVIAAAKAAPVAVSEGPSTGELVGGAIGAALLFALLLLFARRFRRKDEREEFSLTDSSLGLEYKDDPYANTVDVHKCTSMYCNCNRSLENVSFIPAPPSGDLSQARAVAGLSPIETDKGSWYPEAAMSVAGDDSVNEGHVGRSYLPVEQRPLRTVSEVPHDSEIDTELESMEGNDDATSIPPPPPSSFHPPSGHGQAQSSHYHEYDEMSI